MRQYIIIIFSLLLLSACGTKINQITTQIETVTETIIPKPTTILETGVPDYFLNKTAFIPQAPEKNWAQPWQDACEEAVILTVKYYFDQKTPTTNELLKDYELLFSQSRTHDINLSQMGEVSTNLYGYKYKIIDNPDTDTIEKYLSDGQILIAPANGQILYQENKYFKNGGPLYHNIVILGYDHRKKQFIVHDVGTQYGAYFKYSYSVLMNSLHDFPDSGLKADINQGHPKLLLLLK